MKRFGLLLMALALASCGGQPHYMIPPPIPTNVSATSGAFHVQAAPATLAAGGTVHLTLTVTGPIQYEVGCVQTLHIWAEDGQNRQVWEEPVPAVMCMAYGYKTLAAGETATFAADWPTSSGLTAGSYSLHGLFLTVLPPGAGARVRENLPPLTVEISQ